MSPTITCHDTDDGALNSNNYSCAFYTYILEHSSANHPAQQMASDCTNAHSNYDTDDFSVLEMCCACGGGSHSKIPTTSPTKAPTVSPTTAPSHAPTPHCQGFSDWPRTTLWNTNLLNELHCRKGYLKMGPDFMILPYTSLTGLTPVDCDLTSDEAQDLNEFLITHASGDPTYLAGFGVKASPLSPCGVTLQMTNYLANGEYRFPSGKPILSVYTNFDSDCILQTNNGDDIDTKTYRVCRSKSLLLQLTNTIVQLGGDVPVLVDRFTNNNHISGNPASRVSMCPASGCDVGSASALAVPSECAPHCYSVTFLGTTSQEGDFRYDILEYAGDVLTSVAHSSTFTVQNLQVLRVTVSQVSNRNRYFFNGVESPTLRAGHYDFDYASVATAHPLLINNMEPLQDMLLTESVSYDCQLHDMAGTITVVDNYTTVHVIIDGGISMPDLNEAKPGFFYFDQTDVSNDGELSVSAGGIYTGTPGSTGGLFVELGYGTYTLQSGPLSLSLEVERETRPESTRSPTPAPVVTQASDDIDDGSDDLALGLSAGGGALLILLLVAFRWRRRRRTKTNVLTAKFFLG